MESGIALPVESLNAKGSGIGYAGGHGISSIGMPGGLAYSCRFDKYAMGCGIENAKGPGIVLQMGILNAKGFCIGNNKGSGIDSA